LRQRMPASSSRCSSVPKLGRRAMDDEGLQGQPHASLLILVPPNFVARYKQKGNNMFSVVQRPDWAIHKLRVVVRLCRCG
jgi:hypothetical protein